jgi:hypothetical protein
MSISILSLRLKGKWSIQQRQGFHYDSIEIIYPLPYLMNFHSYPFSKGGEIRPLVLFVLALNAKGGENIRPKAKGPHHHPCFQKLFQKGGEIIQIAKTILIAKGKTSSGGSFYLAKGKSIQNRGRIFKNLKMPFEIIFLYHWLFAKEFERTFPKDLQKQAKWCKRGPKC